MTDNRLGFTLIEFLIAILILMVGLLGLLQSINLAMDKSVETLFRNEALTVANDRILSLTSRTFTSLSTTTGVTSNVGRTARGIYKNYSVTQVVAQITGAVGVTGVPASKRIDINVRWKVRNKPYSHSVSSILSTTEVK